MTKVTITVEVADEHADPEHEVGLTNEAFEKLTGYPAPLAWLGEVQDVERVKE